MNQFFREQAVIHNTQVAEVKDDYGNTQRVPIPESVSSVCYMQPLDNTEELVGQEVYITRWKVVFPGGTQVYDTSTIDVRGKKSLQVISTMRYTHWLTTEERLVSCVCQETGNG